MAFCFASCFRIQGFCLNISLCLCAYEHVLFVSTEEEEEECNSYKTLQDGLTWVQSERRLGNKIAKSSCPKLNSQ